MPRQVGDEVLDGQAPALRMHAAATPLLGEQRGEMRERPLTQPAERRDRFGRIVAEILPVPGPAIGRRRLTAGLRGQDPSTHAGGRDRQLNRQRRQRVVNAMTADFWKRYDHRAEAEQAVAEKKRARRRRKVVA